MPNVCVNEMFKKTARICSERSINSGATERSNCTENWIYSKKKRPQKYKAKNTKMQKQRRKYTTNEDKVLCWTKEVSILFRSYAFHSTIEWVCGLSSCECASVWVWVCIRLYSFCLPPSPPPSSSLFCSRACVAGRCVRVCARFDYHFLQRYSIVLPDGIDTRPTYKLTILHRQVYRDDLAVLNVPVVLSSMSIHAEWAPFLVRIKWFYLFSIFFVILNIWKCIFWMQSLYFYT